MQPGQHAALYGCSSNKACSCMQPWNLCVCVGGGGVNMVEHVESCFRAFYLQRWCSRVECMPGGLGHTVGCTEKQPHASFV